MRQSSVTGGQVCGLPSSAAECTVRVKLPSPLAVSGLPLCDRLARPEMLTVTESVASSVSSARLLIEIVTALVAYTSVLQSHLNIVCRLLLGKKSSDAACVTGALSTAPS